MSISNFRYEHVLVKVGSHILVEICRSSNFCRQMFDKPTFNRTIEFISSSSDQLPIDKRLINELSIQSIALVESLTSKREVTIYILLIIPIIVWLQRRKIILGQHKDQKSKSLLVFDWTLRWALNSNFTRLAKSS